MSYLDTAKGLVEAVGGVGNITNVSHCATRLRLVLKDNDVFNEDAVNAVSGVKGMIKVGSQQQIIIGKDVIEVYNALIKEYSIAGNGSVDKKAGDNSDKKLSLKSVFTDIGAFFQNAIGAAILPMTGAGMIMGLLMIPFTFGLLDFSNDTFNLLWSCASSILYFIPVFLAYGAATRLNCNVSMAIFIVLMPLCSTWVNAVAGGTQMSLFGIPLTMFAFNNQFVPAMVCVYVYSKLEKFFKKIMPQMLEFILNPVACLIIMIPFTFLIVAPFFSWLSGVLTVPAAWLGNYRLLAVPVLAMLWPTLTIFGMHGAVSFVMYDLYFNSYGFDPVALPSYLCAHLAIGFTALYYFYNSKDRVEKETGLTTGLTMLFGCISEPAIFGVLLRNKKLYLSQTLAAGITGIFVALFGITNQVFGGTASLLGLPVFFSDKYSPVLVFVIVAISAVASFVMGKVVESGLFFSSKKKNRAEKV